MRQSLPRSGGVASRGNLRRYQEVSLLANGEKEQLPRLLTVNQVAGWLNVHPNTVRRWDRQGVLVTYRIGTRGDRRFLHSDVEQLLQAAKVL